MNAAGWSVVAYLVIALLIAFRVGWVFSDDLAGDEVALATFAIVMALVWPVAVALYAGSVLKGGR